MYEITQRYINTRSEGNEAETKTGTDGAETEMKIEMETEIMETEMEIDGQRERYGAKTWTGRGRQKETQLASDRTRQESRKTDRSNE